MHSQEFVDNAVVAGSYPPLLQSSQDLSIYPIIVQSDQLAFNNKAAQIARVKCASKALTNVPFTI